MTGFWSGYWQSLKSLDVEEPVDVYVHRPLAYLLARALLPTPISPNLVTIASMVIGVYSAVLIVSLEPGYEAIDWGGVSHAGGGSHGALHREDSTGPLLLIGCGPEHPGAQAQWTLRDVAPIVLEHFGIA